MHARRSVMCPDRSAAPRPFPFQQRSGGSRDGQALVEACLVMTLLCLLLFALLQAVRLFVSSEVLQHSASLGARARAVGFNTFMVYKVTQTAAISNAGRMTVPEPARTTADRFWQWYAEGGLGSAFTNAINARVRSSQYDLERSRIPLFLGAAHYGQLRGLLDYAHWESIDDPRIFDPGGSAVEVRLRQDHPLQFPFHRVFVPGERLRMAGEARLDNHYPLYLQ